MHQELYFPMRIEGGNYFRRLNNVFAIRAAEKAQKEKTALFLTQLKRIPIVLNDGTPNRFNIKFIRVSVGALDYDNCVAGFKSIADSLARWVGIDDRDPAWRADCWQQPGPRGFHGVRILIDDLSPGEDHVVWLGSPPAPLGPPEQRPSRGRTTRTGKPPKKAKPANPAQQRITLRAFAAWPWAQSDPADLDLEDLGLRLGAETAPAIIKRTPSGELVRFGAERVIIPDVGPCWLYRKPLA